MLSSWANLRAITGHGSTLPDHHISFSLTGKDRICYFASMLALGLNEKTPSYQSPCPAKVRATTWYLCRPQVKEMIQAKQYNKSSKPAFSTCWNSGPPYSISCILCHVPGHPSVALLCHPSMTVGLCCVTYSHNHRTMEQEVLTLEIFPQSTSFLLENALQHNAAHSKWFALKYL
jgi:hypothetical protein